MRKAGSRTQKPLVKKTARRPVVEAYSSQQQKRTQSNPETTIATELEVDLLATSGCRYKADWIGGIMGCTIYTRGSGGVYLTWAVTRGTGKSP